MEKNPIDEIHELAVQLKAIGTWMMDQQETPTGKLLVESAKWLYELSENICGQGYIGCDGGRDCDSDHK